jgi:hypothetical protein
MILQFDGQGGYIFTGLDWEKRMKLEEYARSRFPVFFLDSTDILLFSIVKRKSLTCISELFPNCRSAWLN